MSTFAYPRFRQDAAFLQTPDGVYVKCQGSAFVLKGPSMFQVVSALVPRLDGMTTFEDIVGGLSLDKAQMVSSLLSSLHEMGVVHEAGPAYEFGHDFAAQRLFLNDLGDEGGLGFRNLANYNIVIIGSSNSSRAVVESELRANGVGAASIDNIRSISPDMVNERELDIADILVVVETGDPQGYEIELSRQAIGRTQLFSVLRIGNELILGPWQALDGAASIESLLLRAVDNRVVGAESWWRVAGGGSFGTTVPDELPDSVEEIALTTAAFEIFKRLGGIVEDSLNEKIIRLNSINIEMTEENAIPHPGAKTADLDEFSPVDSDESVEGVSSLDLEEYYELLGGFSGRVAGIVQDYVDDAAPQIPVKVGLAELAMDGDSPVVGFSVADVRGARVEATLNAFSIYSLNIARRASRAHRS